MLAHKLPSISRTDARIVTTRDEGRTIHRNNVELCVALVYVIGAANFRCLPVTTIAACTRKAVRANVRYSVAGVAQRLVG